MLDFMAYAAGPGPGPGPAGISTALTFASSQYADISILPVMVPAREDCVSVNVDQPARPACVMNDAGVVSM